MLATSATVMGVAALSMLLDCTVAPGISGISAAGKPAAIVPTAAVVPGDADGLADAVTLEGFDAGADDVAAPGAGGLQAASASKAPAASAATPVGLRLLMTVTGTVLLVLMPDSASSLVSTNR